MKYAQQTIDDILQLKKQGFSNRYIANLLGISKSGVSDVVNRNKKSKNGPRILILDVETAATLAYCFGRFNINLSQDNIHTEGGFILCACWRWYGEGVTYATHLSSEDVRKGNDKSAVKVLWDAIEQADAIVAHHGKAFDHKVIQARVLANGLPPLPTVKVLDTKLIAKKYLKLPSNKLDSIGEYLGLGRKLDTGGISLWADVQSGDRQAMNKMVEYCAQDVDLLHDVFDTVRKLGFANDVVNAAIYYEDEDTRCTVCGSTDIEPTGRIVTTGVGAYDEYRCSNCGGVHRGRTNILTKEKRKSLLTKTA